MRGMTRAASVCAYGMCDHCGTVLLALTSWAYKDVMSCHCQCHEARKYDRMNAKERKKYWKEKRD